MKGREGKGPPSTDLLVCFPSRAHLTLMPKPICSPARPSEPNKRQHWHNHHHHHHHQNHHFLKKSSNRNGVAGQASPILWAKNKPTGKDIDEPTSPKVTCAGQIKVKPKASSCKNWQSVMEEIEKLHNKSKHKKRPAWVEALGFKKDVMQFLTCLRNIRFDFRCFGAFPSTAITSDDDEDDVDEDDDREYHQDHQNHVSRESASDDSENSRTVFSKWFMVLQENNTTNNNKVIRDKFLYDDEEKESVDEEPSAPPPPTNALLLMRCRSAPAKSWLEEKKEEKDDDDDDDDDDEEESHDDDEEDEKRSKLSMEEEKKRKDNLAVMRCGTDFYKFSSDIAKETWVVGGIRDSLSRSRSWKG